MTSGPSQQLLSDPRLPGLFRFVDSRGRPTLVDADLVVVETLKGGGSGQRCALRVASGEQEMAMKVVLLRRFGQRLAAMVGRSGPRREFSMIRLASSAGLPVPRPVACGCLRRLGAPIAEAVLSEWIDDGVLLRDVVRQAVSDVDSETFQRAATTYAAMIGRVRQAGFADADFGAGQLLLPDAAGQAAFDPVCVDLEAWFQAEPHDADATCSTLAAALVSWWVAVSGDQQRYDATVELIRDRVPEPAGGWRRIEGTLNQQVRNRMAKQIRKRRVADEPAPVRLG